MFGKVSLARGSALQKQVVQVLDRLQHDGNWLELNATSGHHIQFQQDKRQQCLTSFTAQTAATVDSVLVAPAPVSLAMELKALWQRTPNKSSSLQRHGVYEGSTIK